MAETYAQRKAALLAALRRVKQAYKKADTSGEILERELNRLLLRKTIITPATLKTLSARYDEYSKLVQGVEKPIADAMTLSSSYV
jgi:hypothetical protein